MNTKPSFGLELNNTILQAAQGADAIVTVLIYPSLLRIFYCNDI